LTLLEQKGSTWVYERARPLSVARLVYAAEVIADNAAAVTRIHQPDFDPQTTAILATAAACELGSALAEEGTAEIVAAEPGYWQIRTESEAPALLILAETDYPGWRVTVDGQPAEKLTAYTTLRAVCVASGSHQVAWTYVPLIYMVGGLITLLALVLVALALYRWQQSSP
jgi:hypothetical protein